MKVKDLISILESFDENAEVEIEVYDTSSEKSVDSTYDIGIQGEQDHPILTISTYIDGSKFYLINLGLSCVLTACRRILDRSSAVKGKTSAEPP